MSRYAIKGYDGTTIVVGYKYDFGYWSSTVTPEGEKLNSEGMATLFDLVTYTWGTIDWTCSGDTLRRLRDDGAWLSQAAQDGRPGEVTRLLASMLTPALA